MELGILSSTCMEMSVGQFGRQFDVMRSLLLTPFPTLTRETIPSPKAGLKSGIRCCAKSGNIIAEGLLRKGKRSSSDRLLRETIPKKKALLQILLDADGEWVRGVDIRQQMRDNYDLTVPDKPGALAIHLSHYTQWYSEEFRRNLIPGRWVEGSHNHAEFRIGEKYEDELRDWFNKQNTK